jgi:serine/threonine protein kinase
VHLNNNRTDEIYCISEILYQSTHSTLYKAVTQHSQQHVVIKCFEADAHDIYIREMAGFGLNHPNIITYLDTFYLNKNDPCIVFKWYPQTLEKRLADYGQADAEFTFHCLKDILNALVYLNEQGRIHCDIKPHNIYMDVDAESKTVFVLGDLGASCTLQEAQEMRHTVSTPAYLAPERLYKTFYINSDLYSLGVMAYELLVGSRPFTGTPEELNRSHLTKEPPLNNISNVALRDFIGMLMEKNPTLRVKSADLASYILRGMNAHIDIESRDPVHQQASFDEEQAIIPLGFFEKLSLPVKYLPKNVLIFHVDECNILLLEYDNYFELIFGEKRKPELFMKSGAIQRLNNTSFAYVNRNKLMQFNLSTLSQSCIHRFNETVTFFFYAYPYLIFSTKYRNTYLNLQCMEATHFPKPNYLADCYVCIFADGSFCVSYGPYNKDIIWRNNELQTLGEWQLDGPVIGMTNSQNTVLILSIDLQNDSKYVIWAITLNHGPKKITLSEKIILYTHTPGYLFWLTLDNRLFACDTNLTLLSLGQIPIRQNNLNAFSLTTDHRWLIVLANLSDNENIVYSYQTLGA